MTKDEFNRMVADDIQVAWEKSEMTKTEIAGYLNHGRGWMTKVTGVDRTKPPPSIMLYDYLEAVNLLRDWLRTTHPGPSLHDWFVAQRGHTRMFSADEVKDARITLFAYLSMMKEYKKDGDHRIPQRVYEYYDRRQHEI